MLLNQQGKVNVAGQNTELAFTELELRELGLKEDVVRAVQKFNEFSGGKVQLGNGQWTENRVLT